MMETEFEEEKPSIPQRPTGLTVLLILSFIGSGYQAFSYGLFFLMYDFIQTSPIIAEMLQSIKGAPEAFGKIMSGGKYFFLTNFFCFSGSLLGAIMIWNVKRIGFHIYAIAQIILLILPLLFIGRDMIGLGNILLTITFILLYASFYKRMGIKLW